MLGMRTGLCPFLLSKHPLNPPGRFARRPDRSFGRQANRSGHRYKTWTKKEESVRKWSSWGEHEKACMKHMCRSPGMRKVRQKKCGWT